MKQEMLDIIYQILQIVIIPLLGAVAAYVVILLKKKSQEIQANTNNDVANEYIAIAEQIIADAVTATNQTLVDTLKKEGVFTKEEWEKAFAQTKDNVMKILSDSQKEVLSQVYSDLDTWINTKIEATVKELKDTVPAEISEVEIDNADEAK